MNKILDSGLVFSLEYRKVSLTCIFAAIMLSCRYYFGNAWIFSSWIDQIKVPGFRGLAADWLFIHSEEGLNPLLYWALSCMVFYLVLPAMFSSVFLKTGFKECGMHWGHSSRHLKTYGMLLIAILPVVFMASFLPGFQDKYPFLDITEQNFSAERLLYWEIAYFLQFISIEYFFRGFLLVNLEPAFGKLAVIVSMLPYCMIHFGKPFPETIGAIFAGLILGTMALKSRSVIPGIILHYCVAITMDLLSLWQKDII